MFDFVLPLFPEGSLSSSIITTTWVGVFVIVFFNLRFGWVLSGLVVPGYLVPLLLVKPWAAAVIVVECIVAYALVYVLSERMARFGAWCSFFGRDRFFALVLASVVVRLGFDGWLLPWVGEFVNTTLGIDFDYRNNLHSFGLIIISLMANQFWKPGIMRGLFPTIVTVGITYLIVRYGLVEFTNFRISSLSYIYEDVAASILASPKAYIILVVTAFLASRMNLFYGWDFNGILIPSLLALQAFQPFKIVTSFAEALFIYGVAVLVLRTPLFANVTIEGGRKILLFFNIGFIYKMALGYGILLFAPEYKITDYFGFGYLLSTLIAVKVHDKNILGRLSRSTLQIAATGAAVATLVGFTLSLLPPLFQSEQKAVADTQRALAPNTGETLAERLQTQRVALYAAQLEGRQTTPLSGEIDRFSSAMQDLFAYVDQPDAQYLVRARRRLREIDYDVTFLQDRYLLAFETVHGRNWGTYAIDTKAATELIVAVPDPLEQRGLGDAAFYLFETQGARAIAVAGDPNDATGRDGNQPGRAVISLFQTFHQAARRNDVLQVRAFTERARKTIRTDPTALSATALAAPAVTSTLYVKGELPPGLDLIVLQHMIGNFDIAFGRPPFPNPQRDALWSGFAELFLDRDAVTRLTYRPIIATAPTLGEEASGQTLDGYLSDILLAGKGRIARRGTDLYRAPALHELLFLDTEVLTPLLDALSRHRPATGWTEAMLSELRLIDAAAETIGYDISLFRQTPTGQDYVILAEAEDSGDDARFWGTYIFRAGVAAPFMVQVPRPLSELYSLEYATAMFDRMNARALLVSGAHGRADNEGKSDILRLKNSQNFFNLVSQLVFREAGGAPLIAVQVRGFTPPADADPQTIPDALLAFRDGTAAEDELTELGRQLVDELRASDKTVRLVDGSRETAGYEVARTPQARYLDQTQNKEFAILWLSSDIRRSFRAKLDNDLQKAHFAALGRSSMESDLYALVRSRAQVGSSAALPAPFMATFDRYAASVDIVVLRDLLQKWPAYRVDHVVDADSKQAFAVIADSHGAILAVANLAPVNPAARQVVAPSVLDRTVLQQFIDRRQGWLILDRSGRA